MPVIIRPEEEKDREGIRNVNRAAFGSELSARLVDALREGGHVEVSLVAEDAGRIVGHILFSRLSIVTRVGTVRAVSLAPMAVLPDHQRQGTGSMLVQLGLQVCRERGQRVVLVFGQPDFFRRAGFSADLAGHLQSPFGGGALMATELVPFALAGVEGRVEYPPPFLELL